MNWITSLEIPNKWVKHDAQKARASYPKRYKARSKSEVTVRRSK